MAMLNNQRVYSLDMEYDLSTIHIISDIIFSNDIPYDINTLLIGVFVYVDGLIDGLTHRMFLSTASSPKQPPIGRLFWWRMWQILALENLGVTVVEVDFDPYLNSLASSSFAWWLKIHHLIHGSHTITN